MSAVNNLLDKYREARSIASDSALAESLRITRQGVHQWRKGLSWPSEDHVIAMANAIGEPAERWFVAINADRASPAARKIWLRLAQAAAAFAVIYLFSRLDVHLNAENLALISPMFIHYAKSRVAHPRGPSAAVHGSGTSPPSNSGSFVTPAC